MHELIILGGGASGFAAAISYARRRGGNKVLIIEGNDRALKKVSVTGNGQCNLTNTKKGTYFGDVELAEKVLSSVTVEETLAFFKSIGVETVVEESGRVYPRSYQASSVSDLLRFHADSLGVTLLTNELVTSITKSGDVFEVLTNTGSHKCAYLVYALGGAACPKLLTNKNNFRLLSSLKIEIEEPVPALVQLKTISPILKPLNGIKRNVGLSIVSDGKQVAKTVNEIHFADGALSGPATFTLSPYATTLLPKNKEVYAKIDFFPDMSDGELLELLEDRCIRLPSATAEYLFVTLLHNSIGRAILRGADVRYECPLCDLSDDDLIRIMKIAKGTMVRINDSYGFSFAQSTIGGVPERELDDDLSLKKVKNMFVVGEAVNVCGECGGYNLQWAWSSGIKVGRHVAHLALKEVEK